DDYVPTKSQTTQTETSISAITIAPVVTRAQHKQRQNEKKNDCTTNQCRNEQPTKRNVDTMIDSSCTQENINHHQPTEIDNRIVPFTLEDIKQLQDQDSECQHIITNINDCNDYIFENGVLARNLIPPVPFIPKGRIRADIIKIYHDTPANGAHFGRDRTIHTIKKRYYWPNMITDIKKSHQIVRSLSTE
ncbi:unnamed protein product, partial [Adineta ricciae]